MGTNPTDDELRARLGRGDHVAFETLYTRYRDQVFAYLWRMCGDEEIAADLQQEAFIRVWEARHRWAMADSLSGYLLRTARNLLLNQQRHARARARQTPLLRAEQRGVVQPDVVASRRAIAARVNGAIAELPDRPREVFTLKRDAGLSYREIAELLNISTKTVEVHMGRALRLLRQALSDLAS